MKTSTKAKAKKVTLPAIDSPEALAATMDNIARLELEYRRLTVERDKEVQAVREKHDGRIEEIGGSIKAFTALAQTYCIAHREHVFPKGSKSAASALARFGFREGNPTLSLLNRKWTWESVLETLKRIGGHAFVRRVEEVDKDAIKTAKLTDAELATMGVRIDSKERFFVEPKADDAARITAETEPAEEAA